MYKILKADTPINEEQLEKLYREGWKLITIIMYSGCFFFYFAGVETIN